MTVGNKMRGGLLALFAGTVLASPAAAECLAVDFLYEHRDQVLAIESPTAKSDYIRQAIASAWSTGSGATSKTLMAYGMGEGLATAPSRALTERALSLGHGEMLKLAKGAPVDQQRIAAALSKLKEGAAITDDLNIWMDRLGILVDGISVIEWSVEAMRTGDRYAKAKAAQSLLSIGRTLTAKVVGGSMGAVMASASFLDYAITSFGDAAHQAYDANWYNAYREYYDNGGRNGAFWVDLRETKGDGAIDAELNRFWDDPFSYANLQGKNVPRPFIGDALAIAEKKKVYAARYLAERVEPQVAEETARRAEAALEMASKEYRRACFAAKEQAQTLQAVDTILASLQEGDDPNDRLFLAVRQNDIAAIDAALADGADPMAPVHDGLNSLDASLILMLSEGDGYDGVSRLLEAGAPIARAFEGQTQNPLTSAVDHNSVEAASFLLEKGYPPDIARQDGRTALMLASAKGKGDIVQMLLAAGASVGKTDADGLDALSYAANGSRSDIVPILTAAGGTPNRVAANGLSPLIIAAARGDMATVKALVDAGADPTLAGKAGVPATYARNKGHTEVAAYLDGLMRGSPFVAPDVMVVESLMRLPDGLLIPDHVTQVEVEAHVPAKREDETQGRSVRLTVYAPDGRTVLTAADEVDYRKEYRPEDSRHFGSYLQLCEETPPIGGSRCLDAGEYRVVAEHVSGGETKQSSVRFRLGDPFDREAENWGIGDAVAAGDVARIERLIGTGKAKPFGTGFTELSAAAATDNPAVVRAVLDFGVDPNVTVSELTPVILAMMPDRYAPNAARALIDAGGNVNAVWSRQQLSLLHLAALAKDVSMIDTLLARGARVTLDDRGNPPGYYIYWLLKDPNLAVRLGYDEAMEYERKANEPDFDWAEFARRMQPALQQFGQNVAAAQMQYQQRIDDINATYDIGMSQMYQSLGQIQSPYTPPLPTVSAFSTPEVVTSENATSAPSQSAQKNSCARIYVQAAEDYDANRGVGGNLGFSAASCISASRSEATTVCGVAIHHGIWQNGYDGYANLVSNMKPGAMVVYRFSEDHSARKELGRCRP
ncbi:hypothetical protein HH303_03830 [Rhodospirillaceae bacterium KN72]|uniref:Ankyrin repeat domain-containing protein n=1 Tax=Pacificispira spongiicola TaxID=2729598 RepID=A0A7Y0DY38_9PROT|nr:ankyrin repeat domain-containing protein [Pacificispira spongiicola]NMM43593.1 hypothetical protein [Pacificispira spongiicola]